MKNSNIPEIRFKGYFESWEEHKLGDIKDVRDGTHGSPKYQLVGYPLITSKNLTETGLDYADVSLISEDDYLSINIRSKVNIGDIIFGMIGTIGNPVLVERDDFAIKNVALIKNSGNIINEFLIQYLKSPVFIKYINNENVGNTQKFIGLNTIRKYKILYPKLKEQIEIGSFFKQLDNSIALKQQELEILKKTKQGLLQKMFPKEGEEVPELRFHGFSNNWKKCKLGDICNIVTGSKDVKDATINGKYNFYIRSKNVLKINTYSYDGEAILLGGDGNILDLVHYAEGKFDFHQRVYKICTDKNVSLYYLYVYIKNFIGIELKKNSAKTTVDSVRKPTLLKFNINIPCICEQTKISIFFKKLDNTILLSKQQLENLKVMKKAFLQKMLI